jgi:hypothetical protein
MLANLHLPDRPDSEQRLTQTPLGYEVPARRPVGCSLVVLGAA